MLYIIFFYYFPFALVQVFVPLFLLPLTLYRCLFVCAALNFTLFTLASTRMNYMFFLLAGQRILKSMNSAVKRPFRPLASRSPFGMV